MVYTTRRKLQRYFFPAIALGFFLLWILLIILLWGNWNSERKNITTTLNHNAAVELKSKVTQIEGILQRVYHSARTVSLLPSIRTTIPTNRNSADEDIVDMGLMSSASYDTVQQLYNHIASSVDLSEIYIVYDGFDPDAGQVPFLMFDQVIVDKFEKLTKDLSSHDESDSPEEDETEEYKDYVRQLSYFREYHFNMPSQFIDSIVVINSGLLRTCDNTQFLSKSHGHVRHTFGFTLSVPIYGLGNRKFKGLVTAVLRTNVLEAALVGWPVLPITENDRVRLINKGIDINAPAKNFLLEEQTNKIKIFDSRQPNFNQIQDTAVYQVEAKLSLPGPGNWILSNYVPLALLEKELAVADHNFMVQVGLLSIVLLLLWLAVNTILKTLRNNATQLQELAEIDPLTGLPNRRMIGMYLNSVLKTTKASQCFAVIMVDLDDFKQINDSLGHEAGDRMLIEVAHRFNNTLRSEDSVLRLSNELKLEQKPLKNVTKNVINGVVGRLGGDEFLIILTNLPNIQTIDLVISRVLSSLKEPIEIGLEKFYAHASMGIASYPNDGVHAAVLLRNADIALYEAKRLGRGKTVQFMPELNENAMRRLKMMAGLHEALKDEQFYLVYQPELHVSSGKINAAEALLRWNHPILGTVMPLEFIPLLERSGLIIDVGSWVLKTACSQFKEWQDKGLFMHSISVNISIKQLAQIGFADMVANILKITEVAPTSLVLEVTESSFMDEPEAAISTLTQIRNLGVSVAIDDFGTGYSSLNYLQKIPLDILKIDRSFVVESNTINGLAICDMLIQLADRLNLKVVAEGIETQSQFQCLQGADWMQGYFFSPGLLPKEFEEILHKNY